MIKNHKKILILLLLLSFGIVISSSITTINDSIYAVSDEVIEVRLSIEGQEQGLSDSSVVTSENVQKVKELLNQNKTLTTQEAVEKVIQLQINAIIQQGLQNKIDAFAEKLLVECIVKKESGEFNQNIDCIKWSRDNALILVN